MKVYITKYALTQGIFEKDVEICQSTLNPNASNMIRVLDKFHEFYHGEGKEWHRTLESAIKRSEEMRLKKIGSLSKQIAKLQKLNFEKMVDNG